MNRRQAIHHGAGAFVGAAVMLAGRSSLVAQGGAPVVPTPPPATDPRYPMPPSWKRELRQLAPNVYAYAQGGGPGISAAGVSNAGMIAGPDYLVAIDALQGPIPTRSFIAAAKQATGKDFGRLILTHHHGDHVNGNQFFTGTEILSHPYCRSEVLKAIPNTPKMWNPTPGVADDAGGAQARAADGHLQGRPGLQHWRHRSAVPMRRPRSHVGRRGRLLAAAQDRLSRGRRLLLGRAVRQQQLHHQVD